MADQSLVAQWNEVLLDAIRSGSAKPTATSYQLHLTSAAVYDAWAAYDDAAYGFYGEISRPSAEQTEANKAEAISFAAYRMLGALFPDQQAKFDAFLATLGYDKANATMDPSSAAGIGNLAAVNVLASRAGDGSNAANGFADTSGYVPVNSAAPGDPHAPGGAEFDPNRWAPLRVPNGTLTDAAGVPIHDDSDPSTYTDQVALTPHWGSVTPFALLSGDQFRPTAPPMLGDFSPYVDALGHVTTGDQAYRDQVAEVLAVSAALTVEQKVIAEFWADGPRTESPPGHWNQIAQDIALREGHGIDEDAKFFFAVNAALFDASIAVWDAKYAHDFIRPQSAIHNLYHDVPVQAWGGPDQGTVEMLGSAWRPYQNVTFVTPPFPEYVSGHSAFSLAAARTIAAFVGSDAFYDGVTLGTYDLDSVPGTDLLGEFVTNELSFEQFPENSPVVLRWATLTEAAQEAGISRIYGGIHIQDGNLRGQEVGESVAANARVRWEALFTRGGDDRIICEEGGGLVIAGAGRDTVEGAAGVDLVEGGSGDDMLLGAGGNDMLVGGAGNDVIIGGDGEDVLLGGDDGDSLSGGAGDDMLAGDAGRDTVAGGAGNDCLFGGADADSLSGDAGDDILIGEGGADTLRGGDGNDCLLGRDGTDVLNGGAGADILVGGDGGDLLIGGDGADWFVLVFGHTGRDTVVDFDASLDGIALSGFRPGAVLDIRQSGAVTVVEVDNVELAVLLGTEAAAIVQGANLFFHDLDFG